MNKYEIRRINRRIHDAPWLSICDPGIRERFLSRSGLQCGESGVALSDLLAAFRQVPYENLTKILKADAVISYSSAMRYPDELLNDYLRWRTGGTCYSLTAALIALLDSVGYEAYPILADRHYGVDTHCGIVMPTIDARMVLIDPGYLLYEPVEIPTDKTVSVKSGLLRIELVPQQKGDRIALYTINKTNRKLRLTFKCRLVDDAEFADAWQRSFSFEMMTYPVISRQEAHRHLYLQGRVLSERTAGQYLRSELTPVEQMLLISKELGIEKTVVVKALEIVAHG